MQKTILSLFLSGALLLSCLFSMTTLARPVYGELLCKTTGFTCLKIKKGNSWTSLWPDADQRQLVMRINRMMPGGDCA